MEIYPSLISCDILNLQKTILDLNDHCDGYHLDIMDNHFVPNLTWGPVFINAIREVTTLPLHVHLMVDNPLKIITNLSLQQHDTIFFHVELNMPHEELFDLITELRKKNLRVGIALNPETSIDSIELLLEYVDTVLLMSVNPGFSGQTFIHDVTKKIHPLLARIKQINKIIRVGMDGGINSENIKLIAQDIDFVGIAAGVFHQQDSINALKNLYTLVNT